MTRLKTARAGLLVLPLVAGATLVVAGCGAGSVASAVRPKETTATAALGQGATGHEYNQTGTCERARLTSMPVVVDLPASERALFERMVSEGIAVVEYDCGKLRLLSECAVPGSYGYKGVVPKPESLSMTDSDSVRANLPLSGLGIAAEASASMARGNALTLEFTIVGLKRAMKPALAKSQLPPTGCEGATHFVRGAFIGAWSLDTKTSAEVAAGGKMLGAEANGASESKRFRRRSDGTPPTCSGAATDADRPPMQCGAVIQLELSKLADKPAPPSATPDPVCPSGLAWSGVGCVRPSAEARTVCDEKVALDCLLQCDKNEPESCWRLARAYDYGTGGVAQDEPKAAALFKKACDLGHSDACVAIGAWSAEGRGVPKDALRAAAYQSRGCALGNGMACYNLGLSYERGQGVPMDISKAANLWRQACSAGDPNGCRWLGELKRTGRFDGTRDAASGLKLIERGCEGEVAEYCVEAGNMHLAGEGTPKDLAAAKKLYERACSLPYLDCSGLARLHEAGEGVPKDPRRAAELYQKGCDRGSRWHLAATHCAAAARLLRPPGTDPAPPPEEKPKPKRGAGKAPAPKKK